MIRISRTVDIAIDIQDSSIALEKEGALTSFLSKVPVINKFVFKKVDEEVESEILAKLTPKFLETLIYEELVNNGVRANIKVSLK